MAKKNTNLSNKELLFVLKTVKSESKNKALSTEEKDSLYDKLAARYVNEFNPAVDLKNLNFRSSALLNITNTELLRVIIHVLAVLTGYPESSLGKSTVLDDIGMTSLKRETARRRINRYLTDNGARQIISSSEMGRVETIGNLYDLALSKI